VKYLYADNFRGFRKANIPLQDVNFLVGENSTGKTSLLSLVALLNSQQLWFVTDLDFNTADSRLGHFKDLVSISSENQTYFRIGLITDLENNQIEDAESDTEKEYIYGFLMTFVSKNGLPSLHKLSYTRGTDAIHLIFDRKGVRWQSAPMDKDKLNALNAVEIFDNWNNLHTKPARGYSKLASPVVNYNFDLFEVMMSINRELNKRNKTKYNPPIFQAPRTGEIVWLAPVRTKPRRTYDEPVATYSSEGEHTPYLIRNLLDRPKEKVRFDQFIRSIGVDSGLFDSVSVKKYGKTNTSPFELDIVLSGRPLSITNVGYGVSQSLPLIVELFQRPEKTIFIMQQPEVHLHPRAQAAFGDVIFRLAMKDDKQFFIETHSDFTIDRYRLNHKEHKGEIPKSQVLFFERTNEGNQVTPIDIEPSGQYSSKQPPGFREFFFREDLRLLDL
jgi:predicted ATPase